MNAPDTRPMTHHATPHGALHAEIAVASYNIHGGVGTDGHFVPKRICEVLHELRADLIALQEVETRGTGFDMLRFLSQHTGLHAIPGPTLVRDDGDYGNALLTRYRPLAVRHIDLSVRGCEPRGAIDAQLECNAIESGTFALRVIATHLGLRPGERRWQVKRLLTALAEAPEQPTILLGDVNEWFLWGRPLRWLHAYFERTPHVSTFPSRMPFLALDRIWTSPRAHLVAVTSHRTALSRLASDHLPLLARMRLTSR
ncbi:endonuclease [Cupriavidus pauculus]|uniref:Endonuclease n=2 Tax=Burkholderiaceae TaxID=119060 RepID=A0A3G8HB17_9BURK|nr:endonuclease [Cupriavidus pauculus]